MSLPARPLAIHPRPRLVTIGDGHYVLDCEAWGSHLEASQVRRDRNGETRCTLTVRTTLAGAAILDEPTNTLNRYEGISLSDHRVRRFIAEDLARCAPKSGVNWRSLLDDLAFQVGRAEAAGAPAVLLADVPPSVPDLAFTIDGIPLLKRHPQVLFGDGGTLKSYLMLYWAGTLARQGVNVMFCDWELDDYDHAARAKAIWGGDVPKILYVRCLRPLVSEVDRLARLKHDHGIDFAFFDSIAFACQGKPEDSETAAAYYRAVRGLGIGTLHSAHVTKAGDMAEHRPFGSAFWHNGARQTIFAKAEDESGNVNHSRTVALINRKSNLGPRRPAAAYRFDFDPGSVRIARADPASVESLADSLPTWQRLKAAVSSGPLSFAELAEETGIREGTIRKTVTRKDGMFKVIEGSTGVQKVALLETRRAS